MEGPVTSARELRRRAFWTLEVEDGLTVEMRRLDMITLFMSGAIPLPLMAALNRTQELRQQVGDDGASFMQRMSDEDKVSMLNLLRRYACLAIKSPIVVLEDDGDPDHVPVEVFSSTALLKIWQAEPPGSVAPRLTEAGATEFPKPPAGHDDAVAASVGEAVRPEAVVVDSAGGGSAEFIGA